MKLSFLLVLQCSALLFAGSVGTSVLNVDSAVSAGVLFNEVMANAPGPEGDGGGEWIELINCGDREVDLTGWILADPGDPGDVLGPWQVEPGTGSGTGTGLEQGARLEPGGLAIILDPDGDPAALGLPAGVPVLRVDDSALGNGLRAAGDRLILLEPGGALVDSVVWAKDAGDGISWERQVDDAGMVSWVSSSDPTGSTPGRRNAPPSPPPPPTTIAATTTPPSVATTASAPPPPPITSVRSLMDGLIIKLLEEAALLRWHGVAERLDAEAGSRLPDQPFGPETQIWLKTVEGGGVVTARATLDIHSLRSPRSPFRGKVFLRVDRSLPVGPPVAGVALRLSSNHSELHLGPLRGGLGGGLLLRANAFHQLGAAARSAWSGVPTGLRASSASPASETPLCLALRRTDGRGLTLAVIDGRDDGSEPVVAIGFLDRDGRGVTVLTSTGTRAAEFIIGRRDGQLPWRIGGAYWRTPDREGGNALEVVVGRRMEQGAVRWEMRAWRWEGGPSPLADPPPGSSRKRRGGLRVAATVRPPGPLEAHLSVTAAGSPGWTVRPGWWRDEFEVRRYIAHKPGWRLRLRRTVELDRSDQEPDRIEARRLAVLRLWSGTSRRWWSTGEMRIESQNGSRPAAGGWMQVDLQGRGLIGYLRGTISIPRPGLPLYWFEPGPGWLWRLRTDRARVFRIIVGIRTLPEGIHVRLVLVPREKAELLIGWTLRR